MKGKGKLLIKRSNCCNSGVKTRQEYEFNNPVDRTIYTEVPYHECLECHQPCDVHIETWDVDGMKGEDEEENED